MSIFYEGTEPIRCKTCGKTNYNEGIDFEDGTSFCKSCCEKAGMTGDPMENIDLAEAVRLANADQKELCDDYELLKSDNVLMPKIYSFDKVREILKKQKEEFLNQPANQHDQQVRSELKEKIKAWAKENKINQKPALIEDEEFDEGYNRSLDDLLSFIKKI